VTCALAPMPGHGHPHGQPFAHARGLAIEAPRPDSKVAAFLDTSSVSSGWESGDGSPRQDFDRRPSLGALSFEPDLSPLGLRHPWGQPVPSPVAPTFRLAEGRPSLCDSQQVLFLVLAYALNMAASRNDARGIATHIANASPFHAQHDLPTIALSEYIARIMRYSLCSRPCYILAFALICRAGAHNRALALSSWNVHRLLVVAVMVSAKVQDDRHYNNRFYAKIGGIPLAELNALELAFLEAVKFNASVSHEEMVQTEDWLVEEILESSHSTGPSMRTFLAQAGYISLDPPSYPTSVHRLFPAPMRPSDWY